MRVLIALATITAVAGCAALMPFASDSDEERPNRLLSCSVDVPQEWRDTLAANEMASSANEDVRVVAASGDGRTTLVRTWRTTAGTELVLRAGGQRQQIITLKDGKSLHDVQFDDRWATFTVGDLGNSAQIYAWDSRKDGAPAPIATGSGAVIRSGKAVRSDRKNVELQDLATKKSSVIAQGDTPAFFEDTVVWRQNGKLRAMKLDKTEAVLPEPLRDVPVGEHVASDGRTLVWTQGFTLHAWRTDWQAPHKIAELEASDQVTHISLPVVSGDFVSWFSDDTPHVTDVRTGTTVFSGSKDYALLVRGGALTRTGKKVEAVAPLSELSPLPEC